MCRSLVLVNGFWNAEIDKIMKRMSKNKDKRGHVEYFKQEVKDASESSLFYVKLREDGQNEMEINLETKKPKNEELFSNEITGTETIFRFLERFYPATVEPPLTVAMFQSLSVCHLMGF
ncbi:unnamed protein product [Caenorhabditis brenneri]